MTDTTGAPITADAARSEIATITSGGNHALASAYLDKSNPGHAAAAARMDMLHQAAAAGREQQPQPPAASDQAPADGDMAPLTLDDGRGALPLRFAADAPVAQMAEMSRTAVATIKALGLPPEIGRSGISIIENALARRGDTPAPMSDIELQKFEHLLQQRWGTDYDRNCDAVQAALRKAGRGGAWLQQSIRHIDPATAVALFDMLARKYA